MKKKFINSTFKSILSVRSNVPNKPKKHKKTKLKKIDGRRFPITKKLSPTSTKKPTQKQQQQQQLRRRKTNSKKITSAGKQHRNNKRTRVQSRANSKMPHYKRMVIPVDRHKIYQRRQRVNQIRTDHAPMRIANNYRIVTSSEGKDSMGDAFAKLNEDTKKISSSLNSGKQLVRVKFIYRLIYKKSFSKAYILDTIRGRSRLRLEWPRTHIDF